MIPYENANAKYISDQIVAWILFFLFLLLQFTNLTYIRFSPTLIEFLKRELYNLGFEIHRKYKIGIEFLLFNSFSITFFIFINIGIYFSINYLATSLLVRLFIIYMILGISIPILRGVLHDKLIVQLRKPYFIQLEIQIKLIKRKEIESQMVRIYMTSNKLGLKSDQNGFNLHKEISEKKWLPRKGRFTFPTFLYNPYLYLREYSTPINFKEHFLNLVSAIREWDINYEHKI